MILKAIIIDDNEASISTFVKTIGTFFSSELFFLQSFTSPLLALEELEYLSVDVIFLDVEMPELNGFEFLSRLPDELKAKVVLFTAHEHFAINAIRNSVKYYLTKPIVLSELKDCIRNIIKDNQDLYSLSNVEHDFILVVGQEKNQLFNCHKITRIQANRNYCFLYYEDKEIYVSKTLKYFVDRLPESLFYRAHRSHLINYNFIIEIRKNATGSRIFLKYGTVLDITNLKKTN
jgi:two-component system, LytTR family, response regulator